MFFATSYASILPPIILDSRDTTTSPGTCNTWIYEGCSWIVTPFRPVESMNRGNIPGYYYDEEKKKYFKIQANHVAPADVKYNRTNAKREERETKKRRVEEKHDALVRKQTIPIARSLKQPLLGGCGLRREHGDRTSAFLRSQRDEAFIQNINREESTVKIAGFDSDKIRITDYQYLSEKGVAAMAISHGEASHCIYMEYNPNGPGQPGDTHVTSSRAKYASHDSIIGMCHTKDVVLAFTRQNTGRIGNIFTAELDFGLETYRSRNAVGLGMTLWDCKLEQETNKSACARDDRTVIYSISDERTTGIHTFLRSIECFAVDWLSTNTFAVGTRHSHQPGLLGRSQINHGVYLCDVRSKGVASRLQRQDRITGIHVPGNSGTNLLVSSSRQISLYDLRNLRQDQPLLSVKHLSGSTRLDIPTFGDLLAAKDQHNRIQTYSLRTGKHLRTFAAPAKRGLLQRPRWEEDYRGSPYLQACAGNTVQRWTWGGGEEDESGP